MTIRAISRRAIVAVVGALALAGGALPGAAADNVLELQDPDPATLRPGQIATIAGTGEPVEYESDDDSGDGGPAVEAPLGQHLSIDVGPEGSVYVVDRLNSRLRGIHPNGTIVTQSAAYVSREPEGDDWPPIAVALDADGRLYVSNRDVIQRAQADGGFTTIAGGGDATYADGGDGGDGGPATEVELRATSIDAGPDGTVYIADENDSSPRIRKITDDGVITTIAGGGDLPIDTSDVMDATDAELGPIDDIAVTSQGTVYFIEYGSYIRRVDPDGTVSRVVGGGTRGFSGDGGPATEAQVEPGFGGMAVDAADNLLFIDTGNSVIRRIDPEGMITTIAPVWHAADDLAVGPEGDLYFTSAGQVTKLGMNADGLPVDPSDDTKAEGSPGKDPWADEEPGAVLTVADEGFNVINELDLTVGADGEIYALNVADDNQLVALAPDGGVAAIADGADEGYPFDSGMTAVEAGKDGNVYLAAGGSVTRIYSDGTWSVVAGGDGARQPAYDGQLASTAAMGRGIRLASAPGGGLYIADPFSRRVYELNSDGSLGIVAENAYNYPGGIAASPDGDLYVSDPLAFQVRKIDSSGNGGRFAGSGDQSSSDDRGDGGPADHAHVLPHDVAVHPDGTVYISESDAIRAVDTDGVIDTVIEFDDSDELGGLLRMIAFDAHGNLYVTNAADGQVQVLVRPAEISDPFPWWIAWVSAAAVVVLAGSVAVVVRRRRMHVKTPAT